MRAPPGWIGIAPMPVDRKPARPDRGQKGLRPGAARIPAIEGVAVALGVLWIAVVLVAAKGDASEPGGGLAPRVMNALSMLMPLAFLWVAASTLRTARALRAEAARLQAAIDAIRADQGTPAHRDTRPAAPASTARRPVDPSVVAALPSAAVRSMAGSAGPAAAAAPARIDPPQPALALPTPVEKAPLSTADFITALNFPRDAQDAEGFRTLNRALQDHATGRLIRASQDVLTLLSQEGIYMDDLRPDGADPALLRCFAQGERGQAIAALGAIHEADSLARAAARMKTDPVFRDAAHHFLRQFDRSFMAFERGADDGQIAQLADTRTARAFMLLGRVAGTFD